MRLVVIALVVASSFMSGTAAYAQMSTAGPSTVEIAIIPAGGTFFTEGSTETKFGNYTLGGSVTYNINQWIGIEGEVSGSLGVSQMLEFGAGTGKVKTPNIATYSGNVVVAAGRRAAIPYLTGGVGGLTMLQTSELGVDTMKTFLSGNVGGGLKWFANRHWGVRADYRFLVLKSKDDAPAFFGKETRYGHRIYGAIVLNAGH